MAVARIFCYNVSLNKKKLVMSQILKAGAIIHCPHCGEPQDGPVEDYVIPGHTGEKSRATEQCVECGDFYSVMLTPADDFVVEVADDND